jgi:multiple sugar transport system ATP-binding protein
MATLRLEKVSKKYSKTAWGLYPTDLTAKDHEFVVLLGPSGCGKSTTVRLIAGLEEIHSGKIFIGDRDVTNLPPRSRNISMVFQSYAVWPHMTVYDNVAFALKLQKKTKNEIDSIVKEMTKLVSINQYVDRFPSQLSGGQRQRVALARALAVKPDIFLMDEPLSNLDAKLRLQMRTELKDIHHKTQATTLFVTHDQAEALSMADRIVIMKDGKIIQIGTPDEIYQKPKSVFVAGFIGSPPANFFDIKVEKSDSKATLLHPDFSIPLDGQIPELKDYTKTDCIMAVRPEDLELTTESNAMLSRPAMVVEPQGSHQIVSVKVADKIIKTMVPPHPKLKSGEMIHFSFSPNTLHLFDKETEERING